MAVRSNRLPWPQTFQRRDPRSPLDPPEQDVERIAYQRKLRPLLNTAAKIADLLTEYRQSGSDPGVEFEASCQGHTVDWMNFLYTPNRAWVLAQRLRRTGPLDHPSRGVVQERSHTVRETRLELSGRPNSGAKRSRRQGRKAVRWW